MNVGRFVGASIAVFILRTVLNAGFYGFAMRERIAQMGAPYPGLMREVLPAFITIDLFVALLITYLFVKTGASFGGGVKGGATLGIFLALIGPVLFNTYYHFGVTIYPLDMWAIESAYQLVSYTIQGALAAAIYKPAASAVHAPA
jgi:hypothetical protein